MLPFNVPTKLQDNCSFLANTPSQSSLPQLFTLFPDLQTLLSYQKNLLGLSNVTELNSLAQSMDHRSLNSGTTNNEMALMLLANSNSFTECQNLLPHFVPVNDAALLTSNQDSTSNVDSSNFGLDGCHIHEKCISQALKQSDLSNSPSKWDMNEKKDIKEEFGQEFEVKAEQSEGKTTYKKSKRGKFGFKKRNSSLLMRNKKDVNKSNNLKIELKEEEKDLKIKEEEGECSNNTPISVERPALLELTKQFPEWDLGQIVTFLYSSDSQQFEQTQKELTERRVEKSLLEHDDESDLNPIGLKIKKTRAWKNKIFSKAPNTHSDIVSNKGTYLKRLKLVTGLQEVDQNKALKLLQEHEMEPKKVIWKIKTNIPYYKRYLSIYT